MSKTACKPLCKIIRPARAALFAAALLLLALCAPCAAEGTGVAALEPAALGPDALEPTVAALYCGPTQGFYRRDELTLDTSAPYVYFGQFDCWAMVASGTPEDMGPVGWVEAAALNAPEEPELSFADAVPVMIEEDTFLTDEPLAAEPVVLRAVPRGEVVTLLATLGGWGYVQAEMDGVPARAFLPLASFL